MNRQRQSRATRVIMSVPLKVDLHTRLAEASLQEDLPMIALIRIAIGRYLDKRSSREERE